MKSSWILVCALAVAALGLLSAILLFNSSGIGTALLAVTLVVAAVSLLLAVNRVLAELAELHKAVGAFNSEESRDFVNAVDSSYQKRRSSEPLATALITEPPRAFASESEPANVGKSAPLSILSASAPVGKTAMMTPPEPAHNEVRPPEPVVKKEENYKPFAGLSISSPPPPPPPISTSASANFENTLGQGSDIGYDPNATTPPSRMPETPAHRPEPVAQEVAADEMEQTQSFLPASLQGNQANRTTASHSSFSSPTEATTDATIGFAAVPETIGSQPSYSEPVRPPVEPKSKTKLRKRYSTFAGLSLSDNSSSDHQPIETPAPVKPMPAPAPAAAAILPSTPPPPISKTKEKKRYSTFAGLALNDRISTPLSEPAGVSSPLNTQAGTATNLNFSKSTDGLGLNTGNESNGSYKKNDVLSIAPPRNTSANAQVPSPPANPAPANPAPPPTGNAARKRYQTFMGLSLSKTPQPIKRLEETPDQTAPLPVSGTPAQAAPSPAINKGQMGNLVDGFCSLCGSPQAAGNEYSGVQSEPEFCWYCGGKLRLQ